MHGRGVGSVMKIKEYDVDSAKHSSGKRSFSPPKVKNIYNTG
jgi:hypothetical protein